MLKTVLIIVLSVTIFGILFFLYVKRSLKNQLAYYLSKNNKKSIKNQRNRQKVIQLRIFPHSHNKKYIVSMFLKAWKKEFVGPVLIVRCLQPSKSWFVDFNIETTGSGGIG